MLSTAVHPLHHPNASASHMTFTPCRHISFRVLTDRNSWRNLPDRACFTGPKGISEPFISLLHHAHWMSLHVSEGGDLCGFSWGRGRPRSSMGLWALGTLPLLGHSCGTCPCTVKFEWMPKGSPHQTNFSLPSLCSSSPISSGRSESLPYQ